jgi:hypothetical protein
MSGIVIPLFLTLAGLVVAFLAYRNIRRGGARFYTLEREAILRQAAFSLAGSVFLFILAIGLLLYERQAQAIQTALEAGEPVPGQPTITPTFSVQTQPPTATPTPTPDPDELLPTPVPTILICRAIVQGTTGSGLVMRETPGGERLAVLLEGAIVTIVTTEAAVASGEYTWIKVRAPTLEEGWVATEFLNISNPDCLPAPP